MDMLGARAERLHQRVVELLPWYVNGTLEAAERQTVEGHLAGCARCRAELAAARDLARAVQGAEAVAPSPHPVQLARLLARIDAAGQIPELPEAEPAPAGEGEAAGRPAGPAPRRRTAFLPLSRRRLRQLAAAELAALLLLACGLVWQRRSPAPTPAVRLGQYITLTSDAPVVVPPGLAAIHIIFTEDATAGRIRQILTGIQGQIVSGPSTNGLYLVLIPAGPGDDPVDIVVAHLKAQPGVEVATHRAGSD